MKAVHLVAACTLSLSGLAWAAGDHDHHHQALHGGVVSEVKHVDYELVARPESLQLHLRDHGKPVDVAGASARLTLLLGSEKQEVVLQPVGKHFEAQGSYKLAGAKAVALVALPGKAPATVRFVLK
ncbi:MAG: hypothetical protein CVU18_06450 [Betaproteobacteria bacterium HGW-Betaproteobacteria-12]|nr:MAG: hypothetical protein CVU18_06450 [Betaproteobacteria bacterium HGW-Betaproteobacteria-12]